MPKKRKPFVIIRRSGYYINSIINDEKIIKAWKEQNVPLTDSAAEPDKDGLRPHRSINHSIRATCLSFTSATAVQVQRAKCYDPEYRHKFGFIRK